MQKLLELLKEFYRIVYVSVVESHKITLDSIKKVNKEEKTWAYWLYPVLFPYTFLLYITKIK